MKPLPETFTPNRDQSGPSGRYEFKILKRTGDVVLLQKVNHNHPENTPPNYEVIVVQHRPKQVWPDGRVTDERESMPSPEEWGVLGYSPATLDAAYTRFNQLVQSRSEK